MLLGLQHSFSFFVLYRSGFQFKYGFSHFIEDYYLLNRICLNTASPVNNFVSSTKTNGNQTNCKYKRFNLLVL